ncbi:MAG TPA: TPM domain-containing protein [Casimicrobiaceae bacterium]|nr:TPM domain-containing protein [Casimicrobiaceae bacterium]
MTPADLAAVEARIRAVEARTGIEAVAAVVERSDRYHGLRWRAFAAGASVAALVAVVADLLRPDWTAAHVSLVTAVTILAAGLACALLATFSRAFERLFLQRERAEAEARQRATVLFLERELFATPDRTGVLLFASRYERVAVVIGDRGYDGRVSAAEWQDIVKAMSARFRHGNAATAFTAGLDALAELLVAKGFRRGDGATRNILPDRPLEPDEERR